MGSTKKAWKKLAVRFNTESRNGNETLAKADYVEYEQFAPTVDSFGNDPVQGYFCASCEYFKAVQGGRFGGKCKKLQNADVEPFGCCNEWEIIENMDETQHKNE
jgi:hypothetical protein